jgi:hypothetical protein
VAPGQLTQEIGLIAKAVKLQAVQTRFESDPRPPALEERADHAADTRGKRYRRHAQTKSPLIAE